MSPKEVLTLAGNRLAKSPKVYEVGLMRRYRESGSVDGIGEGQECVVEDMHGNKFIVRVILTDLG